jgi:aryl-alcohol dehydrogenase-like predicted oxidoreductase
LLKKNLFLIFFKKTTKELSDIYGTSDPAERLKVLNRAIELGCTFWDTAVCYVKGYQKFKI